MNPYQSPNYCGSEEEEDERFANCLLSSIYWLGFCTYAMCCIIDINGGFEYIREYIGNLK